MPLPDGFIEEIKFKNYQIVYLSELISEENE